MISNSSTRCTTQLRRTLVYTATFVALAALTTPASVWAAVNAARIVYAIGDVSATDSSGTRRPVKKGDFIVSGDTVVTARGRAQLKLTDGGFVALNPDTEYAIEEYEYDEAAPTKSRSFFNLLKGGVRMVTGAVARSNRRGWRMRTSVATIGIRGSGGYFRYVNPNTLRVSVDFGGFTSTDPETGVESDLGPGEYVCSSPCKPAGEGPGDREDDGFLAPPQRKGFESGDDQVSEEGGPIPNGPAPDNTHISYALSVLQTSGGTFEFLNADEDGETTDGMNNVANFASLEDFSFGDPPDPAQVYNRNNAMEIADPTGPGGATFNTELSAEWGRVLLGFLYDDPIFAAGTDITGLSFTWIASSDPTADADLPQLGSGITGIYTDIVGGSFPVHVYDADGMSGDGTVTPVIETGTHQITAEVNFDTGKLELFEINGTFPTATLRLINDDGMTDFSSGFVFFDPFSDPRNSVTTAQAMCVTGCGIFGGAVFGAAGAGGIGITGAYHANTSNPYPPHTFNSSFAVQRTYLGPPLP